MKAPPPIDVGLRETHIHVKAINYQKVVTTQLYFAVEFLHQIYKEVDPHRTHRRTSGPELKERMVDRIHIGEDPVFKMEMSKPMTVERKGDVLVAKATIGVAPIGNMETRTLFL